MCCAHIKFSFPFGMGRFKDQIAPRVLPRLEALLVFLAG